MFLTRRLQSLAFTVLTKAATFVVAPLVLFIRAIAIYFREPRIAVAGALALLVVASISVAIGGWGLAEHLARYAFFLLAAGVILLLTQYVRGREK